jgi:DNA repair protein RecO (recombination protein O)
MKQLLTDAIILARTDYGEADRIITLLTPEQGKISLVAKGVRRIKSKLAGGIELFSVSQLTYLPGRSNLGTLVSSRLIHHYRHIVKDINRTMLGYDLIKQLHKATEDNPEPEYFELLQQAFEALDDATIDITLVQVWFQAQLLRLSGHTPNLATDTTGKKLLADGTYDFNFDDMAFQPRTNGQFSADHVKILRIIFAGNQPKLLQKITNADTLVQAITPLLQTMRQLNIR